MITATTTPTLAVCPTAHASPRRQASSRRPCRVASVDTAAKWSGSNAWRNPSSRPRPARPRMLGLMADSNLADVRSPGTRLALEPIHCPPNPRCASVRLVVAFPAVLQPFTSSPYQNGHMELTTPGVATLSRDPDEPARGAGDAETADVALAASGDGRAFERLYRAHVARVHSLARRMIGFDRSEEHTSELQSQSNLVCRLLLEKKKKKNRTCRPPENARHCSSRRYHMPMYYNMARN